MRQVLLSIVILATIALPLSAEKCAEMPWIGVILQQPESDIIRPDKMGPETGLSVEKIVEGGPLSMVGGQEGDLWWKLDDQILVNMRQLLVLLRMRKVGDEIDLHFFRNGELSRQKVTLASRPGSSPDPANSDEVLVIDSTSHAETTGVAEMTEGEFTLKLTDGDAGLKLLITKGSAIVFEGPANSQEELKKLDHRWTSGLLILRQALAVRAKPKREVKVPRMRYLPKTSEKSN